MSNPDDRFLLWLSRLIGMFVCGGSAFGALTIWRLTNLTSAQFLPALVLCEAAMFATFAIGVVFSSGIFAKRGST